MADSPPIVAMREGYMLAVIKPPEACMDLPFGLDRERLSYDDDAEEARLAAIRSLEDIEWAALETSGRMSFVKKERGEGQS